MTTDAPAPDALEERLRATLAAEAARHAERPDFGALRARADRTVVDLRLPPRRNRARILAAAVVLAVLAAGLGAVVSRQGGDGDPVTSGPAASGWYLPGEGWEVVGVELVPIPAAQPVRTATFRDVSADAEVPYASLDALVVRADVDEPPPQWRSRGAVEETRGSGADVHTVWLDEGDANVNGVQTTSTRVLVPQDGEALVVSALGVGRDEVLALADRWWASGGGELALDPSSPLERVDDRSHPGAAPVRSVLLTTMASLDGGPSDRARVNVHVRSPAGREGGYTLSAPGTRDLPTGITADGRDTGIATIDLPRPVEDGRPDGEVWRSPLGAPSDDGAVVARLPGADVEVRVGAAPDGRGLSADEAIDLVRELQEVERATWIQGAGRLAPGLDAAVWAETLAGTDAPADGSGQTATTVEAEEVPTTTGSTTTTTEAPRVAGGPVLGLLQDLRLPGGDAPSNGFAEQVTVGFVGSTDADVAIARADLDERDPWVLDLQGRWGRDGPVDVLGPVEGAGPFDATRPAVADPRCAAEPTGPGDDALVVITPTEVPSCIDWFALVVRIDGDGLIAEVRLRLWEP